MAKFAHSDVLDNGPAYIAANCDTIIAVLAYTVGDSYATVTTGANVIASAALVPGDFALSSATLNRVLTYAGDHEDASANNTGDPTHIVFLDAGASKVLWVTDESSGQTVTAGNPVRFPSLTYTAQQPT